MPVFVETNSASGRPPADEYLASFARDVINKLPIRILQFATSFPYGITLRQEAVELSGWLRPA
jgi:hypothetical protein